MEYNETIKEQVKVEDTPVEEVLTPEPEAEQEPKNGANLAMSPKEKCRDCRGRGVLVIRHPSVLHLRKLVPCHCVGVMINAKSAAEYLFAIKYAIPVYVKPVEKGKNDQPKVEVENAELPKTS